MIKIEKTEVVGWESAIRGMRNPMNSWEKSDSEYDAWGDYHVGPNDLDLMLRLNKGGPVEAKYRRMIVVYADITAPLYWWKEFDTYKVGTVANSCSTMHKIHAKEFEIGDFSTEHLFVDLDEEAPDFNLYEIEEADKATDWHLHHGAYEAYHNYDPYGLDAESLAGWIDYKTSENLMDEIIEALNSYRERFLETKDKRYWWQMIQLLPTSYNQKRTVMMNYEVLAGIYPKRKNHKLDEWHTFCDWIKTLPLSEIITGEEEK